MTPDRCECGYERRWVPHYEMHRAESDLEDLRLVVSRLRASTTREAEAVRLLREFNGKEHNPSMHGSCKCDGCQWKRKVVAFLAEVAQ